MKFIYHSSLALKVLCLLLLIIDNVKSIEIHIPFGGGFPFPFPPNGGGESEGDSEEGDGKPQVTSNTFMVNSNLGPIRVTQISVKRGKNLSSDTERNTPIQIMRNMDSFVDNMFNNIINDMIMRHQMMIRNHIQAHEQHEQEQKEEQEANESKDNDEIQPIPSKEEEEEIDTRLDEDIEPMNNTGNNENDKVSNQTNVTRSNDTVTSPKGTLTKKMNEHINILTNKAKLNEQSQNKQRKRKMFAQLCKYVFYSLIIFSLYVVIKKLLSFLDFLDPEQSKQSSSEKLIINDTPAIMTEITVEERQKAELAKADKLN